MKANEMRFGPLLSGPKQFVVPYFQRAYSWRRHQWNTLFDDILELYELGSSNSHFLGSMVLLREPSAAGGVAPTLVIDGQQRIVTLSLFLAAIRDHRNILVIGGTGGGKTTLLNGMIHELTDRFPNERLIIIEDTSEIQCACKNYVQYHTSPDRCMTDLVRM